MKCAARFYVAPRTVAAIACIIAAIASTACGRKSEAASADTPPAADGVIVLDSGSPKLAAIDVDTVRVTHERAVATGEAPLGDVVPPRMLEIASEQVADVVRVQRASHLRDGRVDRRARGLEIGRVRGA